MKRSICNEEKQALIQRYYRGETATGICLQSSIPRSKFYSWLKLARNNASAVEMGLAVSVVEFDKLKSRTHRLEQIIEVLKKQAARQLLH